mmetsp:Transcript_11976/g.19537  ORF Transcript_11976/g.19537 Transcript_11976/m.19537 type:complete len:90 (+) Transcript_11976:329-598(+)
MKLPPPGQGASGSYTTTSLPVTKALKPSRFNALKHLPTASTGGSPLVGSFSMCTITAEATGSTKTEMPMDSIARLLPQPKAKDAYKSKT